MTDKITLVEVRPLKPFVMSFKCSLADADYVDDDLTEKDGLVVKTKVPRKRVTALIPIRRSLTLNEIEARIRGDLDPATYELEPESIAALKAIKPGATSVPPIFAVVHPAVPTVKVPADVADNLVSRGIAERVKASK